MKVIAVVGAARRGKTTSIKKSAEEFADMPEFSTYLSNIANDEDLQSVIENKNGMRIAFCSAGDYWEDVDKNIEFALSNKCDILVAASRSRGAGYNRITEFMCEKGNSGLIIKTIDFYPEENVLADNENNHSALSDLTAKHIVSMVKYVITR